jgi:hypothetical protein
MTLIRDIYRLLTAKPLSAEDARLRVERRFARKTAARYSRGNIAIQNESFITTGDLEAERKAMSKIKIAQ